MSTITIQRGLEILPGNRLIVPGCEPTSTVTSMTLMAEQRRLGLCKNAIVDLQDILNAIPGCKVVYGSNTGIPQQKWLILPPYDPEICPCEGVSDWFGVIRRLASGDMTVEEKFDYCNTIGMGYCPSPDFSDIPAPPPSTYIEEGTNIVRTAYTP